MGRDVEDRVNKRESDISGFFFSYPERRSIAEMIIRGSDRRYQYHCNKQKCGDTCRFRPDFCPHDGCGRILSKIHHAEHDEVCMYKPVPCPRGCTVSALSGGGGGEKEMKRKHQPSYLAARWTTMWIWPALYALLTVRSILLGAWRLDCVPLMWWLI